MIPFYLITGFLGSGKTTFLKNILDSVGKEKKIAIIQNEFASSGIDGKLLKGSSRRFHLTEINNGSVFCACLLSNFIETIEQIVEDFRPEMLFLEASGLADPINIAELLQSEKLLSKLYLKGVFCLADAENYFKGLEKINRFQHQLMIADTILLNKADLVEKDMLLAVRKNIQQKNPFASIHETCFASYNFKNESFAESIDLSKLPRQKESAGKPEINVVVLRNHVLINRKILEELMPELQKKCIRIKGLLHFENDEMVSLLATFDRWSVEPIPSMPGPNEWIFFGEVTTREIRKLFKKFFRD